MQFNHKMSDEQTGKTPYTVDLYAKNARRLLDWCERTHGLRWQDAPALACRLVIEGRWDRLSRASKRLYRASLISFMDAAGEGDAVAYLQGVDASDDGCDRQPVVSREKRLTHEQLAQIVECLDIVDNEIDQTLLRLLYAGSLTGLRPGEWRSASFEGNPDISVLTVKNSKNTHGRAHGDYRTLILHDLDDDQRKLILDLVSDAGRRTEAEYRGMMLRVADRLKFVAKRIWPNAKSRPSLYSARHQFAANAKKAGLDRASLAALMGHSSTSTAARHYGLKRDGGSGHGVTVSAIPDDVARVILAEVRRKSAMPLNSHS